MYDEFDSKDSPSIQIFQITKTLKYDTKKLLTNRIFVWFALPNYFSTSNGKIIYNAYTDFDRVLINIMFAVSLTFTPLQLLVFIQIGCLLLIIVDHTNMEYKINITL